MSVLLGSKIIKEVSNGKIIIEPFNESFVGPNSIDITLANKLITYEHCEIRKIDGEYTVVPAKIFGYREPIIDMAKENIIYELEIPEEGLVLSPNILYLGCTNEKAGSDFYIPMYEGRSSMARLGIQSHVSAGFGDIFFKSYWTLEITVIHKTKIYPNCRIGQVYFHQVDENDRNKLIGMKKYYQGKYTNQKGPQKSKSYLDFK